MSEISPEAVRIWRRMKKIRCRCGPHPNPTKWWEREECRECQRWWTLQCALHSELNRSSPMLQRCLATLMTGTRSPRSFRRYKRSSATCLIVASLMPAIAAITPRPITSSRFTWPARSAASRRRSSASSNDAGHRPPQGTSPHGPQLPRPCQCQRRPRKRLQPQLRAASPHARSCLRSIGVHTLDQPRGVACRAR